MKRGNLLSKASRINQQVAPVQRIKVKVPKGVTFVEKVDIFRRTKLAL